MKIFKTVNFNSETFDRFEAFFFPKMVYLGNLFVLIILILNPIGTFISNTGMIFFKGECSQYSNESLQIREKESNILFSKFYVITFLIWLAILTQIKERTKRRNWKPNKIVSRIEEWFHKRVFERPESKFQKVLHFYFSPLLL